MWRGGAVCILSIPLLDGSWADGEGVDILACSFKNNTSASYGGAVYYDGSVGRNNEQMIISSTPFVSNRGSSGGALYTWGVSSYYIYESTFEQNLASLGRGGGIYTEGQYLYTLVIHCIKSG